ncbi:MAG: nitroreductase family protein [Acidobacteriota bacterium]|nr:nitroreductase family protein [Acidobacteriota bacterium]
MEKPAQSNYPLHELIARRWSPHAFTDQPVEPQKLGSLMEAARWAPSCFNEQPWRFIVETIEKKEGYERLLNCLVPFNQSWAGKAPVLMLSVASTRFKRNGKDNRHAGYDTGMAAENLTLQAQALGLAVHQMAGFDADAAREAYGIPEDYEPMAAFAVGYAGEPEDLEGKMAERERAPRVRNPLSETFFSGKWGQSAPGAEA